MKKLLAVLLLVVIASPMPANALDHAGNCANLQYVYDNAYRFYKDANKQCNRTHSLEDCQRDLKYLQALLNVGYVACKNRCEWMIEQEVFEEGYGFDNCEALLNYQY